MEGAGSSSTDAEAARQAAAAAQTRQRKARTEAEAATQAKATAERDARDKAARDQAAQAQLAADHEAALAANLQDRDDDGGIGECPVASCDFTYVLEDHGFDALLYHLRTRHQTVASRIPNLGSVRKQPSIPRPTMDGDCTPAAWATFMYELEDY